MPVETIVDRPLELARVFARRLNAAIERARSNSRRCSLVLPGGSVAEVFFPILAGHSVDWSNVEFFWGDERSVPYAHADSNYRLADELLLRRIAIDPSQIHAMPADSVDLERAAREYESDLIRTVGNVRRVDLALLGLGPDGHVCSLFPNHQGVEEKERLVLAVEDSPKPPPRRLTLTLPALLGAEIYVVGFGATKANAIQSALSEGSTLPAARVLRNASHGVILADPEAARLVQAS